MMRLLNSSLESPMLLLLVVISLATAAAAPSEQTQQATVEESQSLRGLFLNNPRRPKIIGGSNIPDPDRYPYFSLMNGSGLCGAVLISKRFVLTAAHCVGADNDFEIGITTRQQPRGQSSLLQSWSWFDTAKNNNIDATKNIETTKSANGGTEYPYKRLRVHPGYDDTTVANDIALFELEGDVPAKLAPIRLERNPVVAEGTPMTVIGFGNTYNSGGWFDDATSDELLRAVVDYVPQEKCSASMPGDIIGDDMLCAYKPGSDSCQGDSGGPLILESSDGGSGDSLVGLVSWGYSCAGATPGVYTRISHFYDWIVQSMCEMNPSGAPNTVDCSPYDTPYDSGSDTEITPVPTSAPSSGGSSIFDGIVGGDGDWSSDDTTDFPANYDGDEDDDDDDDWLGNDDDFFSAGALFDDVRSWFSDLFGF